MLPIGSIFFPLIVDHLLRISFFHVVTCSKGFQKFMLDDEDTSILRVCVYLLLIAY